MTLRSLSFLTNDLNLKTVVLKPPAKTFSFYFRENDEAVDLTVERVDTPLSNRIIKWYFKVLLAHS